MKVVEEYLKSTVFFIHLMLTLSSSISMAFQPRSEAGASGLFGILATVRIRRSSWKEAGQEVRFVAGMVIVHEKRDPRRIDGE